MKTVLVQEEDFDPGVELLRLGQHGAIASFVGHVRGEGSLITLQLEHYPGMTEQSLISLADMALARWPLAAVTLVHRFGSLRPGDRIVFVGTASRHRAAALEACAFLIDRLKTDAQFWKKEQFADGRTAWVAPREADQAAAGRWG